MRYLVGTLIILIVAAAAIYLLAGAMVSPVMATPSVRTIADACLTPGMWLTVGLVVYSVVYLPSPAATRITLGPIATAALWWFEVATLWFWICPIVGFTGWVLIWGDNGPPLSYFLPHFIAVVAAGAIATATSLRISFGLATASYVVIITGTTAILLLLSAPYFLWHL